MRQMMDSFNTIFSQTVLEVLTPEMTCLLDESFETSSHMLLENDLFDRVNKLDSRSDKQQETTDATTNKCLTDLDALVLSENSDSRGE